MSYEHRTVTTQPDLLQNILCRALERRSLHLLAMAFRLKYPRWGSQSVLITMGLSSFLEKTDWDLQTAEYRILDYMDIGDDYLSHSLRSLRLTQIRHLVELNDGTQTFTLRPANTSAQATELTRLANQGYLLHELKSILEHELDAESFSRLNPLVSTLTLNDYLSAVHPDDRDLHPNALDQRVMFFKQRILNVANEYASHTIGNPVPSTGLRA